MQFLTERPRYRALPWTVRLFLCAALLVAACALAVSPRQFLVHAALVGAVYVGTALLFALTRNDWIRFGFSAAHFILSGLVVYGLVFLLPGRDTDALFPLRVVLIFGATLVTTALLWHPDTGRWVLRRG